MNARSDVSVVIPTYRRGAVLLQTIDYLLAMSDRPAEILIVDQTEEHEPTVGERLVALDKQGAIRWIRLQSPSITRAMNCGLMQARQALVLFLDDDIRPEPGLIEAHAARHSGQADILVAGRVIQPWEEGVSIPGGGVFRFCGTRAAEIDEFMGGNFSLRRDTALALRGFDENFVRVAYRFEAEFAHRFRSTGRKIFFEPAACLHHLKAASGGTRTFGEHLTTSRPDHAVGAYYYALRIGQGGRGLFEFLVRPMRAATTRYHLRHPWQIPLTLIAECRGMIWAASLAIRGPRLLNLEPGHD
jgi:GT2 family glycosyltransferase